MGQCVGVLILDCIKLLRTFGGPTNGEKIKIGRCCDSHRHRCSMEWHWLGKNVVCTSRGTIVVPSAGDVQRHADYHACPPTYNHWEGKEREPTLTGEVHPRCSGWHVRLLITRPSWLHLTRIARGVDEDNTESPWLRAVQGKWRSLIWRFSRVSKSFQQPS